jgi:hypothetical protein
MVARPSSVSINWELFGIYIRILSIEEEKKVRKGNIGVTYYNGAFASSSKCLSRREVRRYTLCKTQRTKKITGKEIASQ